MAELVLDASAVLAHLRDEPGADEILNLMDGGLLSAVNLTEIVQKLVDDGLSLDGIAASVDVLPVRIVAFDQRLAMQAAILRGPTRRFGLSLGDRACIALAVRESLPVLTADRVWADLDLGVEVVLIR